jgi:alanine dehydrogenase
LTNATLRYGLELADRGLRSATARNPALALGVNVYRGAVTHPLVATDLGYPVRSLPDLLKE